MKYATNDGKSFLVSLNQCQQKGGKVINRRSVKCGLRGKENAQNRGENKVGNQLEILY